MCKAGLDDGLGCEEEKRWFGSVKAVRYAEWRPCKLGTTSTGGQDGQTTASRSSTFLADPLTNKRQIDENQISVNCTTDAVRLGTLHVSDKIYKRKRLVNYRKGSIRRSKFDIEGCIPQSYSLSCQICWFVPLLGTTNIFMPAS